jgi:hypothetical protein
LKTKQIAIGSLAALALAAGAGWFSLDKETRGLLATVPTNRDLLFWTQPQREWSPPGAVPFHCPRVRP